MIISEIESVITSRSPFLATYTLTVKQQPLLFGKVEEQEPMLYDMQAFSHHDVMFHDTISWSNSMKARIELCQMMRSLTKTVAKPRGFPSGDIVSERVFSIEPIFYRNKQIDSGIVLSRRKYKWTLRRKYSPCYAKIEREYVSELSPQRRNFAVYIPKTSLSIGSKLKIIRKEYKTPGEELYGVTLEVGINFVRIGVVKHVVHEPKITLPKTSQSLVFDEIVF